MKNRAGNVSAGVKGANANVNDFERGVVVLLKFSCEVSRGNGLRLAPRVGLGRAGIRGERRARSQKTSNQQSEKAERARGKGKIFHDEIINGIKGRRNEGPNKG